MRENSTSPRPQTEQADQKLAELRQRWARGEPLPEKLAAYFAQLDREERAPQLQMIGGLAVALRTVRENIADLLERTDAGEAPVDTLSRPSTAMTWGELRRALTAWDYEAEGAMSLLESLFTQDVQAAMFDSFGTEKGEEDLDGAPAGTTLADLKEAGAIAGEALRQHLAGAELPAAKGKPYWLQ